MIKDMPALVFAGSMLDAFVKISLILILVGKRKFYSSMRFFISVIVLGTYVFSTYMLTDNAIRTIFFFILPIILVWFIINFKKNFLLTIIIVTFSVWVTMALSDALYMIFIELILKFNINEFRSNSILVMMINSLLLFTMTLFFSITSIRRIICKISKISVFNKNNYIVIIIFISVIFFSSILYICQFDYNPTIFLIVTLCMVIIYTIVVIITMNQNLLKKKIQSEYDVLVTNLSEYENLLDRQRISNHENKNQLLVIKGMIEKEEDAIKYIDTLVENQYKDSDDLIMKTNRIPSGGLKGLIYYKTLIMKDKNINVSLEVNSSISKIDFSRISIRTNQELCKIIGVFLDNAIQEVENLDNKSINIIIENNIETNSLIIKISNNYGYSDISKIGEKGYTTKGNGHGYGLRLVKNIIDSNKNFIHKTEITGKVFSQLIILKLN